MRNKFKLQLKITKKKGPELRKVIAKKTVGKSEYRLVHWLEDGLFVIYRFNKGIKAVAARLIPMVYRSRSRKKAEEYLNKLGEKEGQKKRKERK